MLKSIVKWTLLPTTAAVLVACGGGGGGGVALPKSISGVVLDGYIEGATVCLDLNANLQCDPNEPSAFTDKDGRYSLSYDGSLDGLLVLAVVPEGATDSELGRITKAFDLMSPAENALTVTPITTLVAADMSARKVSADDAVKAVTSQFGFQKPLLGYDFKKEGDSDTLQVAQVIAASMASVKDQLTTINKNSNLGIGNTALIKAVNQEVANNVLPKLIRNDGTSAIDVGRQNQTQLINSVSTQAEISNSLDGRLQQIVARSKAGDSVAVNMANVFKEGIIIAQIDRGDFLDAQGNRVGQWSGFSNQLVVESLRYDPVQDKDVKRSEKVWTSHNNQFNWFDVYQGNEETEVTYVFSGTEWIKRVGEDLQGAPTFVDNCLVLPIQTGSDVGTRICAVSKDLSGKKLSDFLKAQDGSSGVCKRRNGFPVPDCDVNQVFPPNSIAYDLSLTTNANLYEIWTGSDDWDGYDFKGKNWQNPGAVTPTITAFVERLSERTTPEYTGSNCSLGFLIKDFQKDGNGKVTSGTIKWGLNTSNNGCNGGVVSSYTEESKFHVENVGGKEILRVPYPNLYRQANPGDFGAGSMIFGVVEKELLYSVDANNNRTWPTGNNPIKKKISGIFNGQYSAKGATSTIVFNGSLNSSVQVVNKVMLDTTLNAMGIRKFPE
jgi:hypothetical protein